MINKYDELSKLSGLRFSEMGVVKINKTWNDVGIKIVDSLEDGNNRIKRAIKEGKKVLLLPGVYDILHAGHISWIYEAYTAFINKISREDNFNYKREDIYVVIPMDNDSLARAEKIKLHESYGGNEKYLRPIIYQERRSLAIANVDLIDLVIPLYSPLEIDMIATKPKQISIETAYKLLNQLNTLGNLRKQDYEELSLCLSRYRDIITPNLDTLKKDFARLNFPKETSEKLFSEERSNDLWSNQSWQLYLYQILNDKSSFRLPKAKNIPNRIVSKRDSYSDQTRLLMSLCGISIDSILDKYITSTTEIIANARLNNYNLADIIN